MFRNFRVEETLGLSDAKWCELGLVREHTKLRALVGAACHP